MNALLKLCTQLKPHGVSMMRSACSAVFVLLFSSVVSWGQTVATPTFLPVTGTSLTKFNVVVTCPTAGATIRYTLSGAEPTIYDLSVASGGIVTVDQNITLKAKAFNGAISSTTAATTFDLTGDLSAGSQDLLALVTNGQVYGWGNQNFGRLSNGVVTNTNVLAPALSKYAAASNITNAFRISAGANHALLLDTAGAVWGFGSNTFGEAGNSSTATTVPYAAKVVKSATLTDFFTGCTKVSAGLEFSAAVETGGFVRTWGNQLSGRLGNGVVTAGSRKFAGRVKTNATTDLVGIVDVAAGKDFALAREPSALETAGALGKVWVWGNNASGNLGLGTAIAQSFAVVAKFNATTDLTDAWDMDAGDDFAAVIRWKTGDANLQGSVWTFGNRVNSSLGDNGVITGTATFPVQVQKLVGTVYSPLTGIQQISCGANHTLALDNLGNVWAWGGNATGALGDNTVIAKKYATKVRNAANTGDLANIARVSAGGLNGQPGFSTAVAKDGTIYFWGSNANGIQANGSTSTTVFAKLPVVIGQLKTQPGFPTVTLVAVTTTLYAPGAATLTATVADPQGIATILKTEFFLNGVLAATKTASPWTAPLTALTQGYYHAYAKTTDIDSNVTTSLPTTFSITANPDFDADGLLDSWELSNFGNLTQTAAGDPDGDSVNNQEEFLNGSNPNLSGQSTGTIGNLNPTTVTQAVNGWSEIPSFQVFSKF
jgi:alpha-tubulin suppressor-like RCC1 family protein